MGGLVRILAASALFLSASIGNAFAGNGGPHDWTGPYIGADVGYAWGETGNQWRSPGAGYQDWQPDGTISYDSAMGGGYIGYLAQYGRLVFGAEIDISAMSLKGDDSQFAGEVNAIELNYVGTIRGRLGYAFDNSLLYATGGFAYSDYTKKDETLGWSQNDNLTGWTVGAGYEYALGENWSARIEYLYTDLGSVDSLLTDGEGSYYYHRASDVTVQSMRAGLTYGF